MYEVKIIGTGSYAPSNVVTNDDIAQFVDTSDKWISDRTGIKERRISKDEDTSVLSTKAAKLALENANVNPKDIDLIILATATPDYFIPSTACIIQEELGAVNATCFDISAACTGFIYGVNIATQFIKTGQSKTALVIGAEVLSKIVDWDDRNTCILFGDGAGAAILQRSDEKGIISVYTGSDGSGGEHLECPAVPLNNKFSGEEKSNDNIVSMNGREIFKFATKIMPKCIDEVLKNTEYNLEDIKYIVPHQANTRIIEYVAKKLNIDLNKFYMNLDRYGNTSGGSIPIALDEMVQKGLLNKGDKIILVGFGGGLTFGAELIEWRI
ncbi:beta-ketoacyl-ACP synthase III [Clostridium ganghwense]|uniref:Beta-ketoacyl-[acyl-carrier-protein] synthase III n=1 Tax=Clostridium ganghwense TaxID=312089 RepID=A0ABT4CSR4_9CLOT|nr:beta-ketoacyl-ACP synthase III [Clostridium ganghwense]MCY6372111.1 ketoacyl-ACP synthase III [Clostridium ganghwense]